MERVNFMISLIDLFTLLVTFSKLLVHSKIRQYFEEEKYILYINDIYIQ